MCVWIELIFAETENWNWKHCSEIIFKCVNSAVGPIFNKKLLKNVICGTMNSAQMHCSQLTKSTIAAEPKKKKEKNAAPKRRRRNNFHPNGHNKYFLYWHHIILYQNPSIKWFMGIFILLLRSTNHIHCHIIL